MPTEAGEALLAYARRIIALNDEAAASLGATASPASVRVGLPQDFVEDVLPDVIKRFSGKRPNVHVEVRAGRNYDLDEDVRAGRLDVAIAFSRPGSNTHGARVGSRIAVSAPSEQWRADFSRRVFHESFVANRDIESEIVLSEVLAKLAISPSEAIAISPRLAIAEAKTPNVKQLLIQQNNRAEALGIFGAPSFVARGELFWGNDRLERCIEWALGTHPINGNSH